MVTQRPLEALFMVRIHVGQPLGFANKINAFLQFLRAEIELTGVFPLKLRVWI